jgi:DNA-3-methyladenine glycosylase I
MSGKCIRFFSRKLRRLQKVQQTMNKKRCFGAYPDAALDAHYHDTEWGVVVHDDTRLFEMLILEGAQAGLSWQTILKKRSAYRKVFYNFDPKKVQQMSDQALDALCHDPTIVRNRLKIYATRQNALCFVKIQKEFHSFDRYVWDFVDNTPIVNHWKTLEEVPSRSPESEKLSKDLKKRGMTFVGPTIMYAFMQAVGMVNDHLVDCWLRSKGNQS